MLKQIREKASTSRYKLAQRSRFSKAYLLTLKTVKRPNPCYYLILMMALVFAAGLKKIDIFDIHQLLKLVLHLPLHQRQTLVASILGDVVKRVRSRSREFRPLR